MQRKTKDKKKESRLVNKITEKTHRSRVVPKTRRLYKTNRLGKINPDYSRELGLTLHRSPFALHLERRMDRRLRMRMEVVKRWL